MSKCTKTLNFSSFFRIHLFFFSRISTYFYSMNVQEIILRCSVIVILLYCLSGIPSTYGQDVDSASTYLQKALAQPHSISRTTYLQKALEWSIRSNQSETEIVSLYQLGLSYQQSQLSAKAKKNFEKCIQRAKKSSSENSKILEAQFESTMQLTQMELSEGDGGKAYKLLSDIPTNALAVVVPIRKNAYNRLRAQALMASNRENEALSVLDSQFKWEVENDDYYGQIETRLARGDVYSRLNRQSEAQTEYLAALEMAKALESVEHITRCNNKLAINFRQNDQLDRELYYRNGNVQNYQMNNDNVGVFNEQYQIADAYIQSNQLDKAEKVVAENVTFSQNNIVATSTQNNELQALQLKSEILSKNSEAYRELATAYDNNNNHEKAIQNYRKYMAFQDSVNAIREQELQIALSNSSLLEGNEKRINDLEKDRELSDQRIQLLEQEKTLEGERVFKRNIIISVLIFCVMAGIIGGYLFVRLTRSRRKADKLIALQSLTGQMNPHFIFNALNSVNEYIGHNDERAANRYLSSFSKLMRQVMDDSRKSFIPLQEELDMLNLYLQLEHARFSDRFNYSLEVDPNMDIGAFEIPPMLLQPYIENAIWHGLRYREEFGSLSIAISEHENVLEVVITDNGIGIERSKALKTSNQRKQRSLAMRNTETRIRLIHEVYNYPIQLHISSAFANELYPGTRVVLRCPNQPQTTEAS
jgi:two-component system, LytTR family, sensor kinase